MILGKNAIILDVEEAKKLLAAIRLHWTKEQIEEFAKLKYLCVINDLSSNIKDIENDYD